MRRSLLLLSIAFSITATAQTWCPPGATWTHSLLALAQEGHITRTYVGDTIFDGMIAQKIHESGQVISYFPQTDTTIVDEIIYTSLQGDLLLIWTALGDFPEWDTLHRFDAVPGDRWFPPGADDVCSNGLEGMLSVTDTGSVVIDGTEFRTWDLIYLEMNGQEAWSAGRFTERLGYDGGFIPLPGACIIIEYGEQINCYSDEEIIFIHPNGQTICHLTTSFFESVGSSQFSAFPNPGTDKFTLQLPPGDHAMKILDPLGRNVIEMDRISDQVSIGTASLPPGIYTIRITDRNGQSIGQQWMKE